MEKFDFNILRTEKLILIKKIIKFETYVRFPSLIVSKKMSLNSFYEIQIITV